jgi:serine/threonine protein kinase/sugar lactone lactonase YvrE
MARRFENYKILAEIGRGGMGIVYKAVDERSGKAVAIKQLILENIDSTKHKEFRDRFRREAQTAQRLIHKNIVSVVDISADPDSYYYVMEFLEGHSLRREIANRGGKCAPATFLAILEQIAEGLSYAHSMNVIHRDVKPDNIFILEDGTVKITDFGIARVADLEETNLTKTGVMLGTLAYVSPEQLQNAKTVDHRADIFSLGVVSYEALCGYLPFTGDGIAATIVKIMSQEEIPLTSMNPSISPELSGTVSRALRKKPRDRYRSVNEFIRDFRMAFEATMGGDRRFDENLDIFSTAADMSIPVSAAITPADINLDSESQLNTDPDMNIPAVESPADETNESVDDREQDQPQEKSAGDDSNRQKFSHRDGVADPVTQNTVAGPMGLLTGSEHRTGDLNQSNHLPDTTFASANIVDFGLEVSLDKGGVLKDKQKSKYTNSGNYKQFTGNEKLNPQERRESQSDISQEIRPEQFRSSPPPAAPGKGSGSSNSSGGSSMAARMAKSSDPPFMPSSYNPIKLMMTIKTHGPNEKPFTEPTATSYRSGRLLVADGAMRVVHMFSLNGRWLCDLTHRPEINSKTGGGKFTKPSGIAIDERSRIYVCDSSDHYIRIFDGQGLFIKEFKNIQGTDGGLAGICIDSTGLLYVADSANGMLQVFQSDLGVWVRGIGSKGEEPGQLQLPSGLATDKLNRVYVVDYGTSRVSVFNKSGALVRTFGKKGNQRGMFNVPRAVAIDKHDRIFVLDSLNHRIQVFGQGGDWLYTFGSLGSGPEEFVGPSGLSIDNENSLLFVADKGNKRIQVLELGFK